MRRLSRVVVILVVLLIAACGQKGTPATAWSKFYDEELGFSVHYPQGWSVSKESGAGAQKSTRLSTNAPTSPGPAGRGSRDADVWITATRGTVQETWPRGEIEELRRKGYRSASIVVADLNGIRLTDRVPHAGLYDVAYLSADDATFRIHLSTETTQFEQIFETILRSFALEQGRLASRRPTDVPTPYGQRVGPTATPIVTRLSATATPSRTATPTFTPLPTPSRTATPTATGTPNAASAAVPRPTVAPTLAVATQPRVSAPDLVDAVSDTPSGRLAEIIVNGLKDEQGVYGVAVKHLITGEFAQVNGDRVFESASLYKVPVMYETFHREAERRLSFAEIVTVTEKAATSYDDGEPTAPVSSTMTIDEAVYRMIVYSDNTAAHVLLDSLDVWRINQTMNALGLKGTEILHGERTTPVDMLRLLDLIATGRAVDADRSRAMLRLLLSQAVRDRIPRYLPAGTRVAHKTGNWTKVRHDAGIIYGPRGPFVVAALAEELDDPERGSQVIAELARLLFDYFK
ncbi:MAG: serine hydrolase [Chloroflexi bacterium]|nr:serine hydrolase [Chloroflexota bacterium]